MGCIHWPEAMNQAGFEGLGTKSSVQSTTERVHLHQVHKRVSRCAVNSVKQLAVPHGQCSEILAVSCPARIRCLQIFRSVRV